jgi:hypothetical protein
LPGDVLLIEGLGSAPSSTEPARIVGWAVQPASKPKPPPRAKLVAARPEQPCLALLREADDKLGCTEECALNFRPFAGQELQRRAAHETGTEAAVHKQCLLTEASMREPCAAWPMPREPRAVRWPPTDGQPEAEQP